MALTGTVMLGTLMCFYLALGLATRRYTYRTRFMLIGVTAVASAWFYLKW